MYPTTVLNSSTTIFQSLIFTLIKFERFKLEIDLSLVANFEFLQHFIKIQVFPSSFLLFTY
jgi:hypothetical protein